MPPTLPVRAHKPLIHFLGRRVWPSSLPPAQPHPAAPPEYRKTFLQQTADALKSANTSFHDHWNAPARFWRPRHHELQQSEIDAIHSGGASLL